MGPGWVCAVRVLLLQRFTGTRDMGVGHYEVATSALLLRAADFSLERSKETSQAGGCQDLLSNR